MTLLKEEIKDYEKRLFGEIGVPLIYKILIEDAIEKGIEQGKKEAQKEFLDFLDYLWQSGCVEEGAVINKIEELKKAVNED